MSKKFRSLSAWIVCICAAVGLYSLCVACIPDDMRVYDDSVVFSYPVTAVIESEAPAVDGSGESSFDMKVSLLGVIPLKNVTVISSERPSVIPGGEAFGLKFYTDGVIVVGVESFTAETGAEVSPSGDSGVRLNDIITKVNNKEVTSNEQLLELIGDCKGKPQKLTVRRGRETVKLEVTPQKNDEGVYKIGVWVRDSTAGIGTVTFYLENGAFAGLGHGICDVDTGELLPLRTATVWGVDIFDVKKSVRGRPGELRGVFDDSLLIGTLIKNSAVGGYGKTDKAYQLKSERTEVALSEEVTEGKVTLRCTVDGEGVKEYSAEIVRINRSADDTSKNMLIRITDPELLSVTGGIVQGMSGSPIFQNGRLIGAVTHVLVNQPDMGYGIFIENMLAQVS